jgi:hypothetical protein
VAVEDSGDLALAAEAAGCALAELLAAGDIKSGVSHGGAPSQAVGLVRTRSPTGSEHAPGGLLEKLRTASITEAVGASLAEVT